MPHLNKLILSLMLFLLAGSNPLAGQTLFKIPDTVPDYKSYRYPDECNSAVFRVTMDADNKETLWRDTIDYESTLVPWGLPGIAKEVGSLCMSRLHVDTVPLQDAQMIASILSRAGMHDDSDELFFRLLRDSIKVSRRVSDIGVMLAWIVDVCTHRRPASFHDCKKFFDVADSIVPVDSVVPRMVVAGQLLRVARRFGRFDLIRNTSHNLLKLWEMQPPSRRDDPQVRKILVDMYISSAIKEGFFLEELDSLVVSTDAYRQLRDSNWNRYALDPIETSGYPDNLDLPSLKGYWFFKNEHTVNKDQVSLSSTYQKMEEAFSPIPGKVNIIAFLQGGCHEFSTEVEHGRRNAKMNCWPGIASLKRFKERYPDLEITIMTKTYGLYANGAPLTPAAEADTLASLFLGFHRIPGVQIVAEGEFMRIPGLDNRRIDSRVDYEYDYEKEGLSLATPGLFLFVDEVGKVFHADGIVGIEEVRARKKVEAVLERIRKAESQ